jgi:hypothetical protein
MGGAGWGRAPGAPPEAVGWELNARGKLGARVADLGPFMDPHRLAESAVDLNLRLMKWRAAPLLDIGRMSRAKCLLLGAGAREPGHPRQSLAFRVYKTLNPMCAGAGAPEAEPCRLAVAGNLTNARLVA